VGPNVQIRLLEHGLAALIKGVNGSSLERRKASLWKVQVLSMTTSWWRSTHPPPVISVPQSGNLTQVASVLTTPFLPTSHSMSFDLTLGSNAAKKDRPTPLQLPTPPRLQTLGNNLVGSLHPCMRSHASMVLYPTIKVSHISSTRLLGVRGEALHLKTGTTASTLGTIQ
jgi:hypothetical protein